MVPAAELAPGMVLSRDLCSPQGTLLLAAGYVFDARVVRHVREFAQREGVKLMLHICIDLPLGKSATTRPVPVRYPTKGTPCSAFF